MWQARLQLIKQKIVMLIFYHVSYVAVELCVDHCHVYFAVDGSRCRISAIPGQEGSDYINASYVDVSVCSRVYTPFYPTSTE